MAEEQWLRLGRQGQDRRKQFNPGSTVKAEPVQRADGAGVWDEKGRRQEVKAQGLSSEKGGVAITHNGGGGGGSGLGTRGGKSIFTFSESLS